MRDTARFSLLILGLISCLAGCSTTPRAHFRDSFRRAFSIQDGEIQRIQFYLSHDVLLRTKALPEDNLESADRSVLIRAGTPGVARSTGPDWIRISFEETRATVAFVTRPDDGHDGYYLGTILPHQEGLHRVADMEEPQVWYDSRRYDVVEGADTALIVDADALRALANRRQVIEGREQ